MYNGTDKNAASEAKENPRRELQWIVVSTLTVISAFVFFSVLSESSTLMSHPDGVKLRTVSKQAHVVCSSICDRRRKKRSETFFEGANLLDRSVLVARVKAAKGRLLEKLKKDYGEHFDPIFVDSDGNKKANSYAYRPVTPATEDGISIERLKRKLMIKVLSMQSELVQQDSDFKGCDCSGGRDRVLRNNFVDLIEDDDSVLFEGILDSTSKTISFEKYVWATGGHSAAAGHGNLYNESYTAYMESDLKDVFGSIGIDFVGRNYAMGGTGSATTVSMCFKEIFGNDVDFFSWDYGMTDGRNTGLMLHYMYRGALAPTRPAVMMIHYGGRSSAYRQVRMKELDDMGLASFLFEENAMKVMRDNFPDSAGLSKEVLDTMPEYVKNYRCGASIEKGDPYCDSDKYTTFMCTPRMKQASWHPGYKDHAMVGHGLSLFLMEALLGALQELEEHPDTDTTALLSQLLEEDTDMHKNFTEADLPKDHLNVLQMEEVVKHDETIDASFFFKGSSMCHTARLPAQIRYKGILTETDEVGGPAPFGEETYYVGFDKKDAKTKKTENGELRVVYEINKERELCKNDEVKTIVKPDYPDSFYANYLDGWTKLTFPNNAEKKHYGYDPSHHRGFIVVHPRKCDWGKCPKGMLTAVEDHEGNNWEMKINNEVVSKMINMGAQAVIAKGKDGFRFPPNENGQYEIQIKVNKENHYLELSDFVLY